MGRPRKRDMSEWNFMDFASKDNLLRTVREQSDQMLALASEPSAWENPTASGHWQVRDVVGHLVDTTEGYFAGWDAAHGKGTVPDALGVKGMDKHVDEGALALRSVPQDELLAASREGPRPDDEPDGGARRRLVGRASWFPTSTWARCRRSSIPVAQLVDYTVHTWDIRQGSGRSHAMDGDAADLLVPFCFIVWQSTAECESVEPFTIGLRITGNNGGETRASVTADGIAFEPGDVSDLPLVLDFDPASFVLTAMGRINGGTAHGDGSLTERFCNLFFRI